jgi:PIN domain nuclease of toxin-antitoxin system
MAIKAGIGKLSLDIGIAEFWELLEAGGIEILPLSSGQMTRLATLPTYHKDPFDRLIIAAAIEKAVTAISSDSIFAEYLPRDKILLV